MGLFYSKKIKKGSRTIGKIDSMTTGGFVAFVRKDLKYKRLGKYKTYNAALTVIKKESK